MPAEDSAPDAAAEPAGPEKVTVRLTLFADPVEVFKDELPNLRGQGLLIEDEDEDEGASGEESSSDSPPPAGAQAGGEALLKRKTGTSPPA
jgi:hypothetical protein